MSMRVTYAMQFDVPDGTHEDVITALLGTAFAQIEDARVTLDDGVEQQVLTGRITEKVRVEQIDDAQIEGAAR